MLINNPNTAEVATENEVIVKPLQDTPPRVFTRNQHGLLMGTHHEFDAEGFVDWRSMIPSKYLVPNAKKTKETDISKLEDKDLIILLGGIKYLAQLRGYSNLTYSVYTATNDYVAVACRILWLPNYETLGQSVTFESLAGASIVNTTDFGRHYLIEIAENRAFCRCVRNFLKVNIVSKEELGDDSKSDSADDKTKGINTLSELMLKKKVSFEDLKAKLISEEIPDAETFNSINDIPKGIIFNLIDRLIRKKD